MNNFLYTNSIILIAILQYLILRLLIKYSYGYKFFLAIPNSRSSHNKIKPRNGGIAIFISFIIFSIFNNNIFSFSNLFFLIGVFFIGLLDDYKSLNFKIKLLLQILFSFFLLFSNFNFLDIQFYLLILGIIFFINLINFMDGADGYISVNSILVLLSILFYLFYFENNNIFILRLILFYILINLVFLKFNFYPSKIFLGDSGSYFHAGVFIILLFELYKIDLNILVLTILCFMPYISDSLITILIRFKNHKNIFLAHKEHIYQLYLKQNHNNMVIKYVFYYFLNFSIIFIAFYLSKNLYISTLLSIIFNFSAYLFLFKNKTK